MTLAQEILQSAKSYKNRYQASTSTYFEFENKVIRISDHRPNMINFGVNEKADEVFLLFVNQDENLQDNPITMDNIDIEIEKIDKRGYYVDGIVLEEDNAEIVEIWLNKFLNS